jgi:predicted ester cyclase
MSEHSASYEAHRSLYLSYLEYCNAHDFDAMRSFYLPTIRVNDAPIDPSAVTDQFAPVVVAFPDWRWDMGHLIIDGDFIAVHFTVSGTHRAAFQGIEATGRQVKISEFTLYRVQDSKFAEVWDYADMPALLRQLTLNEDPVAEAAG